jgi:hypothetical protein
MSLLPLQTVKTIRQNVGVVIGAYGFECDLYIPKPETIQQREGLDIYQEKPDLNKEHYQAPIKTKVFVEWKPDTKRLRSLGIFVEENIPIVGWFLPMKEITRNSYIKVAINYIEGEWSTDEFELVDRVVKNMYNATVVEGWLLVPRRRHD